ncbi:MAG: hypothetical protein ABR574_01325 [Cryomorphaceae bacterium]|nr:hypothetical protein [Flavobacteriales bacterium]
MKNSLLITIFSLVMSFQAMAQFGYDEYIRKDGLKISTKWSKAKNEEGEKKPALLFAIENLNDYHVDFSFEILLYYEGLLKENGVIENECLESRKSLVGKLNGIYFIPEKFTEQQLKNSDFNFEVESIMVEETENCE